MEKPLFLAEKPSPNLTPRRRSFRSVAYQKTMVFDFSKTFKTYDAKTYKKEDFTGTRCPRCYAAGRFKLHGSYRRHAAYWHMSKITCEFIEIKRIKCLSCKTTHAVMPGDLIPYKLLSLFIVLFILGLFYLEGEPVLKIAEAGGFSFQFIYSALYAYRKHASGISQYFREASAGDVPPTLDDAGIVSLIREPFLEFQSGYIELNKRPCFMCKFFNSAKAPPIGRLAPIPPPVGSNITLE